MRKNECLLDACHYVQGMRTDSLYLAWGSIAVSPLGYAYLAIRFAISFFVTTLLVIWDLIVTFFQIGWRLLTDLVPYLLIVAVIFLILFLINRFWPQFVDFLNAILLPLLQFIVDDFIRYTLSTLSFPLC